MIYYFCLSKLVSRIQYSLKELIILLLTNYILYIIIIILLIKDPLEGFYGRPLLKLIL